MKKSLLAAVSSAALLFAASAWADGGPVAEEAPPPPPPVDEYEEPAPVHEPAPAPDYNWYTTIFAGVVFGDDVEVSAEGAEETGEFPLNTGYLLGWTLGYDNLFGAGGFDLRPEVELSFRQQDLDFQELEEEAPDNLSLPTDILSLMANLWIDFELNGVTPYVGGGVGIGWADLPLFPFHFESTDFVWQFGGGLNFDVNERVFVGVGYRYFGGNFEVEDVPIAPGDIEFEYRAHEAFGNIGVRF